MQRTGGTARITVGKGTKRLHISQLTSVQLKPAGQFIHGFIAVGVGGGTERRSQFGRQTMGAAHDENSVVFTFNQRGHFQWLATVVQQAQTSFFAPAAAPTPPPSALASVGQELERLVGLLQQGYLSRDEFERQKGRLLG